jgi:hypothetical protein
MGNDLHTSHTELPVLPPTTLRLADDAAVSAPIAAVSAAPRPITISPPSSLSTTGALHTGHGNTTSNTASNTTSHVARTVPIASPSADVSTPPAGHPRIPTLPTLPTLPTTATVALTPIPLLEPELVDVVQAVVEQEESRFVNDGPQHPMAHLMPPRTRPTEAQLRANELRASNRKKARRAKVLVVVAVVAIGAFAGPPLAAWVVDAINESGATTDQTDTDPTDGGSVNPDNIEIITGGDG